LKQQHLQEDPIEKSAQLSEQINHINFWQEKLPRKLKEEKIGGSSRRGEF
jgi:hypothetical protein